MACKICDLISGNKEGVVFENDVVLAILKSDANSIGQVSVIPKEHYTIFEQVPDEIVEIVFDIANKLSLVLVEAMGAQGVNLLVNNGISAGQKVPHFLVDLVPRFPEDGVNLAWTPKQMSQEELSTVEMRVKETMSGGKEQSQQQSQPQLSAQAELGQAVDSDSDDEIQAEDYLLKSIERIP